MSRGCSSHYRHSHRRRRSRSCGALAMAVRVSLFGAATAAVITLYRQFWTIVHTLAPAYVPQLEDEGDSETHRATRLAELKVAKMFEGISGVEVYQSLRIPDPGLRERREIDLVILTKRDLFVVEVKNWSGFMHLNPDGSWLQTREDGSIVVHPNVLGDLNYRVDLLGSYIERRGVTLSPGFIQQKVFLINPECRPEQAITMLSEILSADQWEHFSNSSLGRKDSGWLKYVLSSGKSDLYLSELERKQLQYILKTAPTWDRLELEDGKVVVGEFQGFNGRSEDTEVLSFAQRSAVSHLSMNHRRGWVNNMFGTPKVVLLVTLRDYRDANVNLPSKKQRQETYMEAKARADTEVLFQVVGASKPQHFRLYEVLSLSLSS